MGNNPLGQVTSQANRTIDRTVDATIKSGIKTVTGVLTGKGGSSAKQQPPTPNSQPGPGAGRATGTVQSAPRQEVVQQGYVVNSQVDADGNVSYSTQIPGLNQEGTFILAEEKNKPGSFYPVVTWKEQGQEKDKVVVLQGDVYFPNKNMQRAQLGYIDPTGKGFVAYTGQTSIPDPDKVITAIRNPENGETETIVLPIVRAGQAIVPKVPKVGAKEQNVAQGNTATSPEPQPSEQTQSEATKTSKDEAVKDYSAIEKSAKFLATSPDYVALSPDKYKFDLKYATADNFTGQNIYGPLTTPYINKAMSANLDKASELLQDKLPGAKLVVYDAARPLSAQQALWDIKQDASYVSKPDPNKHGGHTAGMSIDVGIVDKDGKLLDMGTAFDYFGKKANSSPGHDQSLVTAGEITKEAAKNRGILRSVMMDAGFTPLSTEWWHFDVVPSDNKGYQELKNQVGDDSAGYQKLYKQNKEYIQSTGKFPPIKE